MASSTTISLSLATFSSTTSSSSFSSRTRTSIFTFKSHENNLASVLFGAKVCANRTPRAKAMSKRIASDGATCLASSSVIPSALLFDCDGALVDSEKDGHRISFNETFDERELGVTWDVDLYGELLKIGGGKKRMTAYFNKTGWPEKAPKSEEERKEFIASLQKRKTELFMALVEKKLLPL